MTKLKGFEFVTTLVSAFKKTKRDDKPIYSTFYWKSKAEAIINESDIDDIFDSIYSTILSDMQRYLWQGLGLIIDSFIGHNINI